MADVIGVGSTDTAGLNSTRSSEGAVMDEAEAGLTNGSETQQQQQETGETTERRRRTAVFVHGPVVTVRDRVFHALFYRLALIYARAIPHQLRRVIEFALLFEVIELSVVNL